MSIGLVGAFTLHNLVKDNTYRLATFVQLTLLRFVMPVTFVVGASEFTGIAIISAIFYLHFRGLAYLDSKNFLVMPGRKNPAFGLIETLLFFPLIIVLCFTQGSFVYGEVWVYYSVVYAIWYLLPNSGRILEN